MVSRIEIGRGSDNVTWQVYRDGTNFVTVDRTGIMSLVRGQDRQDNAIVSAAASDVLQMLWDAPNRIPLADLIGPGDDPDDPEGNPDKTTDPNKPTQFHARVVSGDQLGVGQNAIDIYRPTAIVGGVATHLIGRGSLLTVIYTGSIETATITTESPPQSFR